MRCTGLVCGILLLGGLWLNPPAAAGQQRAPARIGIDHLILGINSLESGMKAFAALTGVTPIRGGEHPGVGTENALVALGEDSYLELIAPKPGVTPKSFVAIVGLERLTPVGWALHTGDLHQALERLRQANLSALGPFPGSRVTPDGKLLTWQTAHPTSPGLEGAPFLIEWGAKSAHPSSTAPRGCRLTEMTLAEPAPDQLNAFFQLLGLEHRAETGPKRQLKFTLSCPRGEITFSS
jgi:glyoxalase-like protein